MTKSFTASIADVNGTLAKLAIQFTTAIPGATACRNIAETPGEFDTLEGTTPDGFKFTHSARVAAPGTEADAFLRDPANGFAVNPYTIVTANGVDPVEYAGVSLRTALAAAGVAGAQPTGTERAYNDLLRVLSSSAGRILTMDQVINGGLADLLADGDHDQGAQ